jgi:hypothetical protein
MPYLRIRERIDWGEVSPERMKIRFIETTIKVFADIPRARKAID